MANINPAKFAREVRQEASKVTWPSLKDTRMTTIMVLITVAIASIFFFFVDWVIGALIQMILGV